ncbi:hypothetical protein DPMN_091933 [Dreissena polymorpha]|uniref:Uncharacterized protein n=1 Tax=Dreissena polymorpha TaxID=45954 RepID=A0A9D4L0E8_DREPO|nr:hypothetical protein DPMN_091933 [Dreissena polymorpha]
MFLALCFPGSCLGRLLNRTHPSGGLLRGLHNKTDSSGCNYRERGDWTPRLFTAVFP